MKNDKWVIIGKASCPWCDKAIALLEHNKTTYDYFSIELNPQLRTFIKSCGLNTVPQVYKNGQLIGGYAELETLLGNMDQLEFTNLTN